MSRFPKPSRGTVFSFVEVGITSTLVLEANKSRINVLLINDSDTVMYLMIGDKATIHEGIRLNAEGGSYEIAVTAGTINEEVINACHIGAEIDVAGTKRILIVERNNR